MMQTRGNRSSSLFLMELILVILFFALSSMVCVQLFAAARRMDQKALALNLGSRECGNVVQLTMAADSLDEALGQMEALYPLSRREQDAFYQDYDASLRPCAAGEGAYTLVASFSRQGRSLNVSVALRDGSGVRLYGLDYCHLLPEGGPLYG